MYRAQPFGAIRWHELADASKLLCNSQKVVSFETRPQQVHHQYRAVLPEPQHYRVLRFRHTDHHWLAVIRICVLPVADGSGRGLPGPVQALRPFLYR